MNFQFGKFSDLGASELLARAHAEKDAFTETPIEKILSVLDRLSKEWSVGSPLGKEALLALPFETGFSQEMIEKSLEVLPEIFSRKNLEEKICSEFGSLAPLDHFSKRAGFQGSLRFFPHGVLLHVSAGNIFLGAIDSLVQALITKNISIVKVSHSNRAFPRLFGESLLSADPEGVISRAIAFTYWKGGQDPQEKIFQEGVDAVIAFGGDEMISSYRKNLKAGIPLLEHGPKISIQVLRSNFKDQSQLNEIAEKIAIEVSLWDQSACASPQNLFIERGVDVARLVDAISSELDRIPWKRGELDEDESVELLKEEHRAITTSLLEGGSFRKGSDYLIHVDPRPGIRTSPLHRTLIVKTFDGVSDLKHQLSNARKVLQSCSYFAEGDAKMELLQSLGALGVQRFAPLGSLLEGMNGAPHDGRWSLMELGRLVSDEVKPLITNSKEGGLYFSSGGTTGTPKTVFFTHDEFQKTAQLLARGFQAQGIERGDVCANLFVAGNLWSSFLAVGQALRHCDAIELPIGGQADYTLILDTLQKFRPKALFGLPSLLVQLASHALEEGKKIEVPHVFYAGEHLTLTGREVLKKGLGAQEFHSAGYASVDAGPIGYQCKYTRPREHHLFQDQVKLEIVDGEAVVTSLVRKSMPVVGLRTGDHVEWSEEHTCACGSTDPKFILHGRIDGQMRVFSSRVLLDEVESAIVNSGCVAPLFQVVLEEKADSALHEQLTVRLEADQELGEEGKEGLKLSIYECAKDLKTTLSYEKVAPGLRVERVPIGALPRIARTGKVRRVLDLRRT